VKVEELDIIDESFSSYWKDDMDSVQWLKLLAPFTAVKKLYLKEEPVLNALQGLSGESVTRMLPALQTISSLEVKISRPIKEPTERFVTARRLSGRPVTVHSSQWGFLASVCLKASQWH